MHAGTLVLYTDQQTVRSALLDALRAIAPCTVLGASETPPPARIARSWSISTCCSLHR